MNPIDLIFLTGLFFYVVWWVVSSVVSTTKHKSTYWDDWDEAEFNSRRVDDGEGNGG